MSVFKCKMCGGNIEFEQGASVGVCEFCGTKQTLPKTNDDVTANLFNRANNLRLKCEFDKAEQIYEKIVQQDDSEAEAHWGIVLCKYGIEYVEDPKTSKRIPTCHRTLFEAVTADPDYLAAIDYSDAVQQSIYEAEARTIDRIQKDILAIVKNEKPFDVFICYKETDENGKRTVDSTIANDIYYQLKQEGFKVFYAAITLEDKLGQEYEPYIFAALNSAKVMLAIGTKPEYFSAVWVKNEWSRYLKLMKSDRSKLLIPCYRDMDAYDLPEEFAHLQAQDMGKIGFINDVVRGIKKIIVKESAPVKETVVVNAANADTAPLLKRAFMALEDGEWKKADEFCEQVLNQDPENVQAYLGKLMSELHVRKQDGLKNCAEPFDGDNNYQKVLRFGDEKLVSELKNCISFINERNENERCSSIYDTAAMEMTDAKTEGSFEALAERFKSISGFRDADKLAKKCLEKAEVCKQERLAKEEADRLEAERKAEERRIAAEKAAKKRKKAFAIGTPIVAACIAFVIVLTTVIIPKQKFNKAMNLLDSGDYDSAYALLEEIGNSDAIASSKYDRVIKLIDSGDYDAAYMLLNSLGYKDSNKIKSQILGKANVGDIVYFGAYEQDNDTSNGKEDIEWIVLAKENGKVLVISKYALDCQKYNSTDTDVTWEKCSLRAWMNGTLLNNAFSAEEQAKIAETNVSADNNPRYNTDSGSSTTDKVFLLSITEAEKYFASDEERECSATKFAIDRGAFASRSSFSDGKPDCWWWLRSPGGTQNGASYVDDNGSIVYMGRYVNGSQVQYSSINEVYFGDGSVRPALWINIGE